MEDTRRSTDDAIIRRLTGRMLMAVIFGLAIWNLIVSVMANVVTPWLGSLMGQNPSLPQSFTRDYDFPDLLIAVVEFCFAGIVAVSINWYVNRSRKSISTVETRKPSVSRPAPPPPSYWQPATPPPPEPVPPRVDTDPVRATVMPAPAPPSPPPPAITPQAKSEFWAPAIASRAVPEASAPALAEIPPKPAPAPSQPAVARAPVPAAKVERKPEAKPKKEKQVYYNIVGDPISIDED